jgi:hypothetical protein
LKSSVTSPAPREVWLTQLKQNKLASIFQTPVWTDSLVNTGRYLDASRLYEFSDGLTIILPLVRQTHRPARITIISSMPSGWGFGGLVSLGTPENQHLESIYADLSHLPAASIKIRPGPFGYTPWDESMPTSWRKATRCTHTIDLQMGCSHLWENSLNGSTRTKIRKAMKSGLICEPVSSPEGLQHFYDLYMKWIEDRALARRVPLPLARLLGKKREPYWKFESVLQTVGEACQIWIARDNQQPVAAAILLVHDQHAINWRSVSNRQASSPVRANELLQWKMIEAACQKGCTQYHMGESGNQESLKRFKEKFGAMESPAHAYIHARFDLSGPRERASRIIKRIEARRLKAQA